jgi:hypothetical protein
MVVLSFWEIIEDELDIGKTELAHAATAGGEDLGGYFNRVGGVSRSREGFAVSQGYEAGSLPRGVGLDAEKADELEVVFPTALAALGVDFSHEALGQPAVVPGPLVGAGFEAGEITRFEEGFMIVFFEDFFEGILFGSAHVMSPLERNLFRRAWRFLMSSLIPSSMGAKVLSSSRARA